MARLILLFGLPCESGLSNTGFEGPDPCEGVGSDPCHGGTKNSWVLPASSNTCFLMTTRAQKPPLSLVVGQLRVTRCSWLWHVLARRTAQQRKFWRHAFSNCPCTWTCALTAELVPDFVWSTMPVDAHKVCQWDWRCVLSTSVFHGLNRVEPQERRLHGVNPVRPDPPGRSG